MLKIKNISRTFNKGTVNETKLFDNFNFEINKKDFVSIVGSNGAGKSTLLNIIAGSLDIDKGEISIEGKNITCMKEHQRSKIIGRVFQDPTKGTSPSMTILENLSLAENKGKTFGLSFGINKSKINYFKEQLSVLNLGLEDKLDIKVGLLSGGQRQSLSLLMATLNNPKLLLLDEHTAALDPKTSETIMELTDKIVKEKNIAALMITHNLNHALKYGNRLLMLHSGNKVLDICDNEKKLTTNGMLIDHFSKVAKDGALSDRVILA